MKNNDLDRITYEVHIAARPSPHLYSRGTNMANRVPSLYFIVPTFTRLYKSHFTDMVGRGDIHHFDLEAESVPGERRPG